MPRPQPTEPPAAQERNYRAELGRTIDFIGECYFYDPERKTIGDTEISRWNTTLLALSYVMDKNALIVGEPGFAKTTGAKVIASSMSGYPFDLYEAAQIQGHPDQTYETMLARLDFAKLKDRESVIWLLSAYLPLRIIDEVNCLSAGKQKELLNALETGRFNYLNSTFYIGRTSFFATANHPDDGNHVLTSALRDRFRIHAEAGHLGATYRQDIKRCRKNIDADLRDEEVTTAIIDIINDPERTVQQRLQDIEKARGGFLKKLTQSEDSEVSVFGAEDRKAIQKQIYAVPLSSEAEIFLQMIDDELNWTPTYGRKRSNDPVDASNHAKKLASTKIKNGTSPRGIIDGLEEYAQALVWLTGGIKVESKVEKVHLQAVVPHCLGHRLDFSDDFKKDFEDKQRPGQYGLTREMFLASKLVNGIEENYSGDPDKPGVRGVKGGLDLLVAAYKEPQRLTASQQQEVNEMLADPDRLDHPLLREYAKRINEARKQGP